MSSGAGADTGTGAQCTGDSLAGRRILVAPVDIASFSTRLARGFAARGATCWLYNASPHIYMARTELLGDAKAWAPGWIQWVGRLKAKGLLGALVGELLTELQRWVVFAWSLWAVDTVVFVYNRSLLRGNLDLWAHRLMGKRVVRVFLGADSRPRYMRGRHDGVLDPRGGVRAARKLAQRVRRQFRLVRRLSRWSDVVVENPLCGHFQSGPFVNWFHIGFPHDPDAFGSRPDARSSPGHRLRVLHCPSNPMVKGTARIEKALERLAQDGVDFEYTKVTGMPHAEVLDRLSQCDVVIDELYSDSPMPGFASEAAAFGKAAIVCGYGWSELKKILPHQVMAPTLTYDPGEFESVLPSLMADSQLRERRGKEVYRFINGYWGQDAVVERFSLLLKGEDAIPDEWWCDPHSIAYWQGTGAPADHRRKVLIALCQTQGLDALMLPPDSPLYRTVARWLGSHGEVSP